MAGKKDKKAKKDDKKTSFLPKVIDGIKLPKEARRQLTSLAKHPVIADLLASGLVALAQRIKGDGGKPEAAAPQSEPTAAPAPEAAAPALVAEAREAAPAKPAVKRIRKAPAATVAAEAAEAKPAPARRTRKAAATPADPAPSTSEAEPVRAKEAKAPPPRRTRKKAAAATKPRTRRTQPKTEG